MTFVARSGALTAAAIAMVIATGCNDDGGGADDRALLLGVPRSDTFTLNCEGLVVGAPRSITRVTHRDLSADPLIFKAARGFSARGNRRVFQSSGGRKPWRAFKTVTVTRDGSEAMVAVETGDARAFLLIYDSKRFRSGVEYARSDGDQAVSFTACPQEELDDPRAGARQARRQQRRARSKDPHGEFPGGFLARKPGCYRVQVVSEANPEPVTREVNVAMGRDGCRKD